MNADPHPQGFWEASVWPVWPPPSSKDSSEEGGAGDGEGAALGRTSTYLQAILFLDTFIFFM